MATSAIPRGSAALALWAVAGAGAAQPAAGLPDERDVERMGAFQCIVCPLGGFLEGIRGAGGGRVHEPFEPFKKLCTASYDYRDGELFVRFSLDGREWPERDGQALKASSWTAECRPVR